MRDNKKTRTYFIRNTHDEDGNYRGDGFFRDVDQGGDTLGVHGLRRSGKRTTLDEFVAEHYHYHECHPYESIIPDMPEILRALADMIECGTVVSETVMLTEEKIGGSIYV